MHVGTTPLPRPDGQRGDATRASRLRGHRARRTSLGELDRPGSRERTAVAARKNCQDWDRHQPRTTTLRSHRDLPHAAGARPLSEPGSNRPRAAQEALLDGVHGEHSGPHRRPGAPWHPQGSRSTRPMRVDSSRSSQVRQSQPQHQEVHEPPTPRRLPRPNEAPRGPPNSGRSATLPNLGPFVGSPYRRWRPLRRADLRGCRPQRLTAGPKSCQRSVPRLPGPILCRCPGGLRVHDPARGANRQLHTTPQTR